jgi:hypothetical protein
MDFDTKVKLTIYQSTAEAGRPPGIDTVAQRVGASIDEIRQSYARLAQSRLLVLESDGSSIRMAPPFSGVPTQHTVLVDGVLYHGNCAWDALGIPAALQRSGRVQSRCEQSRRPLDLSVGPDGPEPCSWLFHCPVPAKQWWPDIVFT